MLHYIPHQRLVSTRERGHLLYQRVRLRVNRDNGIFRGEILREHLGGCSVTDYLVKLVCCHETFACSKIVNHHFRGDKPQVIHRLRGSLRGRRSLRRCGRSKKSRVWHSDYINHSSRRKFYRIIRKIWHQEKGGANQQPGHE